jgi:hypothetical protein
LPRKEDSTHSPPSGPEMPRLFSALTILGGLKPAA